MSYLSANMNLLLNAVKKSTASLNRDFSEIEKLQSSIRGYKEFVAAAIKKVDSSLRTELSKARPTYAFAEANKPQPKGAHFIVSSVDGIVNFAHGIPYFSISVATCENGVLTSAVVYNPATEECYFAEKGMGAYKEGYRNHERLRVSLRKEMSEVVASCKTQALSEDKHENLLCEKVAKKVVPSINANRQFGSISLDLANLAAGKFDAVITTGQKINDIAAGILLVKEAGGSVFELEQKDIRSEDINSVLRSGDFIAGNPNISPKLHELLNK